MAKAWAAEDLAKKVFLIVMLGIAAEIGAMVLIVL